MRRSAKTLKTILLALAVTGFAILAYGTIKKNKAEKMENSKETKTSLKTAEKRPVSTEYETAEFAAGCFWGVESAFRQVPGVISTTAGYTGGHLKKPTYKAVCSSDTGHAETVQVIYRPDKVSYDKLLDVFWEIHDPTTANRQGPDIGSQYRSAIFYHNQDQLAAAKQSKLNLSRSDKFKNPIVTEINPAVKFYRAEEYHQRYLEKQGRVSCSIAPGNSSNSEPKKITKTDKQWKQQLSPEQYKVIRKKATEPAFTGKYNDLKEKGLYKCIGCDNELFSSRTKFDSGSGWPSFWAPVSITNIKLVADNTLFMKRTEVLCGRCDAHLGHVFNDGPEPTALRYCLNSAALNFTAKMSEGK